MSKLSVIIPCFNEEKTLKKCVGKVLEIQDESLALEIIIVDDGSTDQSLAISRELEKNHSEIQALAHEKNQGKGAALRTGFKEATGDYVCVQDADLEYNPLELKTLLRPLEEGKAEVVFGSRFLSGGAHRVLYFWHSLGNKFLTFLSNMFTDLNLTDMETCYKVFKREIIQNIEIEEDRFGFEPEIVAKIAQKRVRIFEIGISYFGRTYEEGKKIGFQDGLRALFCIFHYNVHKAPVPIQFFIYLFIGGACALFNVLVFWGLFTLGVGVTLGVLISFFTAAGLNYILCILLLFKHNAKWKTSMEGLLFVLVVSCVAALDVWFTKSFLFIGMSLVGAKVTASLCCLFFNFLGRRYVVFPEKPRGAWDPGEVP